MNKVYEWLKVAYPLMANLEQCERAVKLEKITKEEFKDITGIDYKEK